MEKNRVAIVNLYLRGKSQSEILNILNLPKTSRKLVYRTIKRYKDTGSTSDKQRSGRPTFVTTTQKRKVIRSRIQRNPQQSMRKMAVELNISRESVRTIVERDLGLFPYKKRKVHFISAKIKEKRLARSKALLSRFACFGLDEILFSDEKSIHGRAGVQSSKRSNIVLFPIFHTTRVSMRSKSSASSISNGLGGGKRPYPTGFHPTGRKSQRC